MNQALNLQTLQREAQRLRAEYAQDLLVRAAIALDLAIRRAAHRLLAPADARDARLPTPR